MYGDQTRDSESAQLYISSVGFKNQRVVHFLGVRKPLGVPFNIASYAALLKLVAQMTGHVPHEFVHTIGDAHIYKNHIEQVEKQLKRSPKPLPTLKLDKEATIDNLTPDMFTLKFYKHHSPIKGDVAV